MYKSITWSACANGWNKNKLIFRIWFHSEPFQSISVSSGTAEDIQTL